MVRRAYSSAYAVKRVELSGGGRPFAVFWQCLASLVFFSLDLCHSRFCHYVLVASLSDLRPPRSGCVVPEESLLI